MLNLHEFDELAGNMMYEWQISKVALKISAAASFNAIRLYLLLA